MCYSTITDSARVIFFGLSCLVLATAAAHNKGQTAAIKENRQLGGIDRHEILHLRTDHAVNKTEALLQDYYHNKERIEKRHLRWDSNQIISTTENPVIVRYFKPHEQSEQVDINEDYLGFTLYKRNGAEVEANTGIFHFVKSSDSDEKRMECERKTLHAGAYRHIYGHCPEKDSKLVASGYCYQSEKGALKYNSQTFNGVVSPYTDGSYYANEDRSMNEDEMKYFTKCFNEWKEGEFNLSFKCAVVPSLHVYQPNGTVYNQAVSNDLSNTKCEDCEQLCNSDVRLIVSSSVVFILVVFQELLSSF